MVEPIKRYTFLGLKRTAKVHKSLVIQIKIQRNALFFTLIGTTKKYNKSGSTKIKTRN